MSPTYLYLFYWWAKPPTSKQVKDYHNWSPTIKRKVLIVDIIILIITITVGPYLFSKL